MANIHAINNAECVSSYCVFLSMLDFTIIRDAFDSPETYMNSIPITSLTAIPTNGYLALRLRFIRIEAGHRMIAHHH